MKQKIGFGTALPDGGWKYMATQDPNPRIPFTHGMVGPDTVPLLNKWEKVLVAVVIVFCVTVLALTHTPLQLP